MPFLYFFSYEELEQQHKYSSNMQFEGYQRPPNGEYPLNRQFKLCMKMYWFWRVGLLVVQAELSNKAEVLGGFPTTGNYCKLLSIQSVQSAVVMV